MQSKDKLGGNMPNSEWIYTYVYAPGQVWEKWRVLPPPAAWIQDECERVCMRAEIIDAENTLRFALLADSHYTINGTWEDTVFCLKGLHERLGFDGVIHLGDLTDGMLPAEKTEQLEASIKSDMRALGVPVHIVSGNHDYNYFKGNPNVVYPSVPQFYVDYDEHKLRLLFIDSFDPKEELRYGFTNYCVHWLDAALQNMPKGYCAIVFSHVPPLVRLQAWAKDIRGRIALMDVMDRHADKILAFINGHNHCDHIFNDLYNGKFPIMSVNCAKCEYFLEHKPQGAVVPYRQLGTPKQESFDVLTVDTQAKQLNFTRFGAGEDRVVKNGKAEWV